MSIGNQYIKALVSLFLIFFLIFSEKSLGNNVSSSDSEYFSTKSENYKFIYPEEYKDLVPDLIFANELLREKYEKEFEWKLDEMTSLTLASSQNQIANAFATAYPNNLTIFFGGGAEIIDNFAFRSWALGLLAHETSHLYQINAKRGLSKLAKTVFRNNPVTLFPIPLPVAPVSFFPLPIVTTPNVILPSWIIEGNAVFNESRFGNGGRLYSGEARALFLSLLKSGKLNERRLSNNHVDFPFLQEKYIIGGYFFLFLAEKFGTEKANSFFLNHARHYFNPFRLNTSFSQHFGQNYSTLIQEFLQKYRPLAQSLKAVQGQLLAKSLQLFPLNRQGQSIMFMANSDMKKRPVINLFDIQNKKLEVHQKDIPTGKIFKLEDQYAVASSELIARDRSRYSLWPVGWNRLTQFDHLLVTDIQEEEVLAIDTRRSFIEPLIVRGKIGQKIDQFQTVGLSNSLPLFGEGVGGRKNLYAFLQKGGQRALIKNGTEIFSYQGYYGKLCDIVHDSVYFIAGTSSGSGLFAFNEKKSELEKVFDADNIVDCRAIDSEQFVLNTVTPYGYEIISAKKDSVKMENNTPFAVNYFFEKSPDFSWFDEIKKKAPKLVSSSLAPHATLSSEKVSSYNSLADIRFNNWTFSHSADDQGALTDVDMNLSDPLNFNTVQFHLLRDSRDDNRDVFSFLYMNLKYRLNYGIRLRYRDMDPHSLSPNIKRRDDTRTDFLLRTHFLRTGRWNWLGFSYVGYDKGNQSSMEYYLSTNLKFNRNFGLNFYPESFYDFKLEGLDEKDGQAASSSFDGALDLGREWILGTSLIAATSTRSEITLGSHLRGEALVPSSISRISLYGPRSNFNFSQGHAGIMFSKVLTPEWYSAWFPVGIRRLVPGLITNYTEVWGDSGYKNSAIDYGAGGDIELLMGHLAPVHFSLYYFKRQKLQEADSFVLRFYSPF